MRTSVCETGTEYEKQDNYSFAGTCRPLSKLVIIVIMYAPIFITMVVLDVLTFLQVTRAPQRATCRSG